MSEPKGRRAAWTDEHPREPKGAPVPGLRSDERGTSEERRGKAPGYKRPAASGTSRVLRGRKVVPGTVAGEALVSHEPISGWGGIDPARGVIIEPRHELFGVCFTGKILVFPSAKGSSGWSGFFQTTRLSGTAPIGMIINRISAKSALGAVVTRVPAITDLDQDPCEVISTGDWVRIDADNGIVEVTKA